VTNKMTTGIHNFFMAKPPSNKTSQDERRCDRHDNGSGRRSPRNSRLQNSELQSAIYYFEMPEVKAFPSRFV